MGPDGSIVMLNGWLDDIEESASLLGVAPDCPALLYAAAVARWGSGADARLSGSYCAIVERADGTVRLSRSPWSAPPLHFASDTQRAIVASVPRVLIAAGVPSQLDPVKLADSLIDNFSDEQRGWYLGTHRVPQGTIVHLERGSTRFERWYDPHAIAPVRLRCDQDYVDAARELLQRATRQALKGVVKPAIALSGGLDSALAADEILHQLPLGQRLNSFTFRPDAAWDGRLGPDQMGDEKPFVDAFHAMHPELEPTFTRNENGGFDHRQNELFAAMGIAPSYMPNYYVYHGVWQGARDAGCDWLFDATLGNQTLSSDGRWSYVEQLLRLRWRQLGLTLARRRGDARPLWRKLASLSVLPLLPPTWRAPLRRLRHPELKAMTAMATMIAPSHAAALGVEKRARDQAAWHDSTYPRSRREVVALDYHGADYESNDVHQGFEQIYGLRRRDVMAYRPLIEFCVGLPTGQFVRDGEERWLAKRLAEGRIPESQRLNPRYGRHDVDWHVRLGRRRAELLAEIERLSQSSEVGHLLDYPKMRELLEDWPATTPLDRESWMPREIATPRALTTARFVHFVSGRNDV
jgi:asparagine synthase (glutamine-hydrolysing)